MFSGFKLRTRLNNNATFLILGSAHTTFYIPDLQELHELEFISELYVNLLSYVHRNDSAIIVDTFAIRLFSFSFIRLCTATDVVRAICKCQSLHKSYNLTKLVHVQLAMATCHYRNKQAHCASMQHPCLDDPPLLLLVWWGCSSQKVVYRDKRSCTVTKGRVL